MADQTKDERTLQIARSFRNLILPLIKTPEQKGEWIEREEASEYRQMYSAIRKQVARLDGSTIQNNEDLAAFYLHDFGLAGGRDHLAWGMKPGQKEPPKMRDVLADGLVNIERGRFQGENEYMSIPFEQANPIERGER